MASYDAIKQKLISQGTRKMKKFQVNSIIRAAALYHLHYSGYSNSTDSKNTGDMADNYSAVGTDRKEFLSICNEYNKAMSPMTKQASAKLEKDIRNNVRIKDLTANKLILNIAFFLQYKAA